MKSDRSSTQHRRRWLILGIVGIAQLMVVLDATIVNIALPSAQHALGFSNDSRQWVITAYALAFGSLLLVGGRIGDYFGRKRALIAGLLGFALASAIAGLAQSFAVLVAARAFQGAFGALLAPSVLSILTTTFTDPRERGRAFGIYAAIAGGGGAIGLLLGGVLTQYVDWRATMFVNLAFAIPAAVGALLLLTGERPAARPKLDLPGAASATAGLFALVYGVSNAQTHTWGAPLTIGPLLASALLLAAFAVLQARGSSPLLPLRVLLDRHRAGSFLAIGIAGSGIYAVFLFATYYMQHTLGLSPLRTGVAFLPMSAMIITTATLVSTRIMPRTGPRPLVPTGMVIAAVAMLLLTRVGVHTSYATHVLPSLLLTGVGMGMVFAPATSSATRGVRPEDAGAASALVNTMQQVGASIGIALLSTFAATAAAGFASSHGTPTPSTLGAAAVHGYTTAFAWAARISLLGALLTALLLRSNARTADTSPIAAPNHQPLTALTPTPCSARRTTRRIARVLATALTAITVLAAAAISTAAAAPSRRAGAITIATLSTRADLVTGGEALVRIGLPAGTRPRDVRVTLHGRNVSPAFAVRSDGAFEGLVTGLRLGKNLLQALLPDGSGAELRITDHPIHGPLFSGPQIEPWTCQPGDVDAECDHPTESSLYYYSTDPATCAQPTTLPPYQEGGISGTQGVAPCFAPYDPHHPPQDVARVTTDQGVHAPFVVRLESLWQDRDQVRVAELYRPGTRIEPWSTATPWNHRVEITQGGACGAHHGEAQGEVPPALVPDAPPSVMDPKALAAGFVVMSTALDNSYHDCNLALQAESLVIAKEHIIDEYGPISYTIGNGCSGGSLSMYQVANAYPGIYQGIISSCTFPDAASTAMDVSDCALLQRYWSAASSTGPAWSPAQQAQVAGSESTKVCDSWNFTLPFYAVLQPELEPLSESHGGVVGFQNCGVPAAQAFNPSTNPSGVRCDLWDYMVNILGRDPRTGYANRPLSNVGVEYGLDALQRRQITPAQFVDLNAKIGDYNVNYQWQPRRIAAGRVGLRNAYRSGMVDEATYLNQVAIIDTPINAQDIHEPYRSFAIRARLHHAHGSHANQVIWYTTHTTPDAFALMTRWLSQVADDHRDIPLAPKIVQDKPRAAHDMINRPHYAGRREAASGPLATDILACTLEPLQRSDFSVSFKTQEWTRLRAAFPSGVCNVEPPALSNNPPSRG
jgi:EmrB/QacA subfamily drug resistance transporter